MAALRGNELSVVVKDRALTPLIVQYLVSRNAAIFAVTPQRETLEDLFVREAITETRS